MSPVVLRGELYLGMSIPRRIRRHVPNLVPISPVVWQLPQTFECVTPLEPPGVLRSDLYLAYVYSQTNTQICTKFGANRSSRLTTFPNIWICDPLTPPNVEGRIVFSPVFCLGRFQRAGRPAAFWWRPAFSRSWNDALPFFGDAQWPPVIILFCPERHSPR